MSWRIWQGSVRRRWCEVVDFTELPTDGVKFEQLVRELLLIEGMRPHWTGQGSDGGRDLLVEETLKGTLQDGQRTWLVDCKHKAHSNKSVGVSDVSDVVDRCRAAGAQGILLACSTQLTSGLARKFQELYQRYEIVSEVWDGVVIEKKLYTPHAYHIAQQFFPIGLSQPAWRIYFGGRSRCWFGSFKGYFVYLFSRSGMRPLSLRDAEIIIKETSVVGVGPGEDLRVRSIWHDTPNGPFYNVCVDYLVPSEHPPALSPNELSSCFDMYCVDGGTVSWSVRLQVTLPQSDYYSPDDERFYEAFEQGNGFSADGFFDVSALASYKDWPHVSVPPIRRFDEAAVWSANKKNFGFETIGNVPVRKS